jgi:hypothetical protein
MSWRRLPGKCRRSQSSQAGCTRLHVVSEVTEIVDLLPLLFRVAGQLHVLRNQIPDRSVEKVLADDGPPLSFLSS